MKYLKLPERLKTIAGYIEKNAMVADVGTDHGLLPVYLAQNRMASGIIATDVSPESLKSALRTAEKYNVTDMITFKVASGLANADETKIDTIIAAGMGGETIIEILKEALWTKKPDIKLILQPQSKTDELCRWLHTNGYAIHDAELTRDNGKIYTVILAGGGKTKARLEPEMQLLTIIKEKRDPLFADYLADQITRTRKAAESMAKSKKPDKKSIAQKQKKLEELMKFSG